MQLRVTLADSTTHDIEPSNPDMVRFDMTATKHRWPNGQEAPFLWLTFLAWSAMKRAGLYTDTWEAFSESDCLNIDNLDEDEDADPKALNQDQPAQL